MLDGTEASFGGDSAERWALGGVTVQYKTARRHYLFKVPSWR